jgi:hypothetical protein
MCYGCSGARVAEMTRLESRHTLPEAGVWAIDIQQSKKVVRAWFRSTAISYSKIF